jgi:hypothetical protein
MEIRGKISFKKKIVVLKGVVNTELGSWWW